MTWELRDALALAGSLVGAWWPHAALVGVAFAATWDRLRRRRVMRGVRQQIADARAYAEQLVENVSTAARRELAAVSEARMQESADLRHRMATRIEEPVESRLSALEGSSERSANALSERMEKLAERLEELERESSTDALERRVVASERAADRAADVAGSLAHAVTVLAEERATRP